MANNRYMNENSALTLQEMFLGMLAQLISAPIKVFKKIKSKEIVHEYIQRKIFLHCQQFPIEFNYSLKLYGK